jgi:hypothetical protein
MTRMTPNEVRTLDSIRAACPELKPELAEWRKSYEVTGARADGVVMIRISSASLALAARQYRAAYQKLEANGMLKPAVAGGAA